jgi:hypothetical protein
MYREVHVRPGDSALQSEAAVTGTSLLWETNICALTAQCWALGRRSRPAGLPPSAAAAVCSSSAPPGGRSRCCLCFRRCWHLSLLVPLPGLAEGRYSLRRPVQLTAWSDSRRLPSRGRDRLKGWGTPLDAAGAVRVAASAFASGVSLAVVQMYWKGKPRV